MRPIRSVEFYYLSYHAISLNSSDPELDGQTTSTLYSFFNSFVVCFSQMTNASEIAMRMMAMSQLQATMIDRYLLP